MSANFRLAPVAVGRAFDAEPRITLEFNEAFDPKRLTQPNQPLQQKKGTSLKLKDVLLVSIHRFSSSDRRGREARV